MGLFDTVICHYKPLSDEFIGTELQTKSLDNTMSKYWITPAGELFMVDWADSMEIVDRIPAEHLAGKFEAIPWEWLPTGNHKKLTPVYYTGKMVVYPSEYSGNYEDWPESLLLFKHGKVIYHETTTLQLT